MLLHSITLSNLLSFKDTSLDLGALNVLIGPNGSGKSNLIEAISLLQAAPRDLGAVIRSGGGVREWIWKGEPATDKAAHLECLLSPFKSPQPVRYVLEFAEAGQALEITEERLENEKPAPGEAGPYLYFAMQAGSGVVNVFRAQGAPRKRNLEHGEVAGSQSVLSALRDLEQFPEITHYAKQFERIQFYREWNMGRRGAPRLPQPADLSNAFLEENAANLALVLNRMETEGSLPSVERYVGRFYEQFEGITASIQGGTVQLYLREKGLRQGVPATRLSDGTLRFLCLLAVLCHPNPPPLVCLEEPELGLHPDALSMVAQALIEASERMQLVVTTHSEALIDALSDKPETVIVCERDAGGSTRFRRLDAEQIKTWLEDYTLGQLWRKGEIGGVRW
jgi:predicted ATPase